MTVVENKWVSGLLAPIPHEVSSDELAVEGTLPVALEGRYLRNGPNPLGPVAADHHWFVGDGMVHGVRLRGGRAEWYRARWVRSTRISEALGEEPKPGERHGGFDGANTNVIGLGGRTYAIVEAGARPVELSYDLDTIAHSDFGGTLPNGYTAHPKVDPATGELHAIAYHWALPHLQYIVVGADGLVTQVEPVAVDGGPMVHDCSITERWMVVYDFPVTFNLDEAMSGASFPYRWNPDRPARVGLLPLGGRGADVRWFEVGQCYSFHPLNAHDEGDRVVIDLVRYERMFAAGTVTGPDDADPLLYRFTIDTATGRVAEEQLSDIPMEFPRVDERLVGRRHRWGYALAVSFVDGTPVPGGPLRIDAAGGNVQAVDLGAGRSSGEWVMAPRDGAAAEDEGWLMSFVHDAATDRSELLVLDAAEPDAKPVARVLLPTRVPLGFHGNWVPDS